ncbi:hypothetical protein KVR01_002881 [Diaporthe batatas]|uniref:uncharacterized protein n=1 Tax=Diaporthe batatas TaxID=748121 RepID=UPI001D057C2B|nr:uncharacterized protein KVR01_002881 [Diaporthe batatas]KAG8167192.1 hypothetical protein KVR01_002881 [Diaporthe batatas]
MKLSTILLVPAMAITPALCATKLANQGTVSFDCDDMPEVCLNMCFGVHCRNGRYSRTFTYDGAAKNTLQARRKAAGCGQNNRCSQLPPWKGTGTSCDEFPFANTREADQGGQYNRCVPGGQNNRQGGRLAGFLNRVKAKKGPKEETAPYLYNIAFLNIGQIQHCSAAAPNPCDADANLWMGRVPAKNGGPWQPRARRSAAMQPTFNHYISKRGEFFTSAAEMSPGDKLYHPYMIREAEAKLNATLDEDARNAIYADPDSYDLIEDEMERIATGGEILNATSTST